MIHRLFTLRSDRGPAQRVSYVDDPFADTNFPVYKPINGRFFTTSERELFGLPLEETDPSGEEPKTSTHSERRGDLKRTPWMALGGIALVLSTVTGALVYGVRGHLDAENRKEKVEACVESQLPGVNLELTIDPGRGNYQHPTALAKEITECEDKIAKGN